MASTVATYVPTPTVTIGDDIPEGLEELLLGVVVEENTEGLARCEVRLDAWGIRGGRPDYLWVDRATVDFGAEVTVKVGPPDENATVFSGKVTGLEATYGSGAAPTFVLLAEDSLQDFRMTRRTRRFEDGTDADAITQIANDHGLTPSIDLAGPTHRQLLQLNQSDLAFVRDRARPLGAGVWLDGTTLHVGRPDAGDPVVLRLGHELLSFRVMADLANQCTEQRVGGWDVSGKEAILESADNSAVIGELAGGAGGGAILTDAFGDRMATTVLAAATTTAEARALARGLYADRARRFVMGTGVADGVPGIQCGRSVELQGLGPLFDGVYEPTRVAHRYDRGNGYRTEIDVQRAGIGS
jgi:uncharacterized protein